MKHISKSAFIIAVLMAAACAPEPSANYGEGESEIKSPVVSDSSWGKPSWVIKAASAKVKAGNTAASFIKPILHLYGKDGKLNSIITADEGKADGIAGTGELYGSVVANSKEEDLTLKTSRLFYSSKKGKIWSDRKVEIKRGKAIVTGSSFTSDLNFSEIEINKQETRMIN